MQDIVFSKGNVPIRLTDERWAHISEEHNELAGLRLEVLETVANPSTIPEGRYGALLAVRQVDRRKYIVVAYRELDSDGFIITAFITSRKAFFTRRRQLWRV
ncbi:MAG: hypothetical protein HYX92_16230 [Chloroflexi bacterium]|nr:hypothetical protein [Chloroflexota bacterium]